MLAVYGTPWCEHSFAVGIAEVGKNVGHLGYAFVYGQGVGTLQAVEYSLGCSHEDVLAIEVLKALE